MTNIRYDSDLDSIRNSCDVFLSPSGDLEIGLVWHNLSGPTFWSKKSLSEKTEVVKKVEGGASVFFY